MPLTMIRKHKPWSFIVNPLGEVMRHPGTKRDQYVLGSVNVCDVARALFKNDEKLYGRWCNEGGEGPISKRVDRAVEREFRRQERELLSPAEFPLQQKIAKFQKLNDSRFRVYGGIKGGKPLIKLVTEIQAFIDETDFWNGVGEVAKATGATIELMDESPHTDSRGNPTTGKYRKPLAKLLKQLIAEGRRINPEKNPGGAPDKDGYVWSFGKDHGRMERQVEVWWDATDVADLTALRKLVRDMSKATLPIWQKYGVNVI